MSLPFAGKEEGPVAAIKRHRAVLPSPISRHLASLAKHARPDALRLLTVILPAVDDFAAGNAFAIFAVFSSNAWSARAPEFILLRSAHVMTSAAFAMAAARRGPISSMATLPGELGAMMADKQNIRNVSIIAHVDHGKSTLTDTMLAAAGLMSQDDAGEVRMTDTRMDESERGISIKATGISFAYRLDAARGGGAGGRTRYLINLVDSPGHIDFSSEVTASLRITDGAIVVVDCAEGVCAQTQTVLHQALRERIKPVMALNKLDRLFLELQVSGEEAYQTQCRVIEDTNSVITAFGDKVVGSEVSPTKGSVVFTSGLHGWGFTLSSFAKLYADKSGVDEETMIDRLWGDNFFDFETRVWTKRLTTSPTCARGFVKFVYEPIQKVLKACMSDEKEKLWLMLEKLRPNNFWVSS
ncbi:hypothetical protein ACP70R_010896 [Stipagrostis hirtigluma subsp. patula]